MKQLLLVFVCCLLIITGAQAQDSSLTRTVALYEENILPVLRETLLKNKEYLQANPDKLKSYEVYNLKLANLYAGLLMCDSSLYYIKKELANNDVSEDLNRYGFLFLLAKEPGIYQSFLDGVFFGKYNVDKATRRMRYLPSDLCKKYIWEKLLSGFFGGFSTGFYFQVGPRYASLSKQYDQISEYTRAYRKTNGVEGYIFTIRPPQYSKDGVVTTDKILGFWLGFEGGGERLAKDKMPELEKLLEQNDISNGLCNYIDKQLIKLGKPQRYGTLINTDKDKVVLKTPHDSLKEIEKHRKQAGLNTVQEMIREKEKRSKEWEQIGSTPM